MMKAVLTGHTRGLGAALADDLLSRDIPVLAIARARNTDLGQRYPALLKQEELDLSDSAALTHWLSSGVLQGFFSRCQTALLINNAGMLQPVGPIDVQDVATIGRAVALNVATPMMLASAVAALPAITEKRIIHVSSGAARNAYAGWSIYCATKAALDQHARAVVQDRMTGLRICSLAPGVIDTDMQAEIRASSSEQFPQREKFDNLKKNGDLASPADCARAMVDYLLSAGFGQLPTADMREITA